MRVITGSARGRKLDYIRSPEVRPTTDRVKESVFSIIQFEVPGAVVLDLFAGSGQMGIEALSRGADLAVFVDDGREPQRIIRANLQSTGLASKSRVVSMDAKSFLTGTKDRFDIAFLDPPYHHHLLNEILPLLVGKMKKNGVILCEHRKGEDLPDQVVDFRKKKQYNYGKISITAYRFIQEDE